MKSTKVKQNGWVVAVLLAGGALWGCSLQTTNVVECRSNFDCRQAFGTNSECNSEGFCQQASGNARCEMTFPPDLLDDENLETLDERFIIIGSIEQRSEDIFRSFERATQLAFRQANDSGGINNLELAAIFCTIEDLGDGVDLDAAAIESADYLVNTVGVPAIVGPARSSVTQSVFQSLVDSRSADLANGIDRPATLLITPSATSNALSDLDQSNPSDESPGLLWRTAPPDSLQGFAIASDMGPMGVVNGRTVEVDNVAVIFEEGPYGDGLAQAFGDLYSGATIQLFPFDSPTARDEAIAAVANDALIEEVLFVSGTISDSTEFFNMAAGNIGFDGKGIFVPDAAATSDVLMTADTSRFDQTRGSRPAPLNKNEDLVFADFLAKYLREFGEDAEQFSFTANAYDAAFLAAYGAAWAVLQEGEVTGPNMARGLRRLSEGSSINVGPLGWNAVIQQFREGGTVNVQGASGDLDYDPATEETKTPIEIWEIIGNTASGIYSIEPP